MAKKQPQKSPQHPKSRITRGWVFTWHLAVKFVLLFVLLFFLQIVLVVYVGGDRVKHYVDQIIYPNLQQQAVYLVADLRQRFGDSDYLMDLSKRLNIDFAIQHNKQHFSTRAGLIDALASSTHWRKKATNQDKKRHFQPPAPSLSDQLSLRPRPNRHRRPPFVPNPASLLTGRFVAVTWNDKAALLYRESGFSALLVFDPTFYPITRKDLWLLGAGTLLLLCAALFITQRLLRPLRDIRQGISHIEQGRFDQPVAQRTRDELGMLAKAFNRMSERIKEQFHQREQLLLDISHELRSPLARMRVAVEFIQEDKVKKLLLEEVEEQDHLLSLLLDNARLGSLTSNFQLNSRRLDLITLIENIVKNYQNPRLQTNLPAAPLWIEADKTLIPRVITNLVNNALKYTEKKVVISLNTTQHQLLLSVSDKGKGIPVQEHARVFTPFYRLDKSRTKGGKATGYGLGLSLCKRIVEAHGGTIAIDAAYTQGTRVCVMLPREL